MTHSPEDAEVLSQKAFIRVFQKNSGSRCKSAFPTWLHRVVLNVVLTHLRKRDPIALHDELEDGDGNSARPEYGQDESVQCFRFGPFEVNLQAREVRNGGRRVKLEEKPFRILELLLKNTGRLVSRQEFCHELWPDTSVGFERRLNTAVNGLRRALGDSAVNPKFVETRPRSGYRFIGEIEPVNKVVPGTPEPVSTADSLAVLPFSNHGVDLEIETFREGITECVGSRLAEVRAMRVVTWTSALRWPDREIDFRTVGRDLGVRALLTGSVTRNGDTFMVTTEVIDAVGGRRLWAEQYHHRSLDVPAAVRSISKALVASVLAYLTNKSSQRLAFAPVGSDANRALDNILTTS